MADLATRQWALISDAQLQIDLANSRVDLLLCRTLLAHGMTRLADGASVQECLDAASHRCKLIRAEQSRRGYARRKARQAHERKTMQGGNRGKNYADRTGAPAA